MNRGSFQSAPNPEHGEHLEMKFPPKRRRKLTTKDTWFPSFAVPLELEA
jgi:hypothetical protein